MSSTKKSSSSFSQSQVTHIAQLANIPIDQQEATELAQDFEEILGIIDNLKELDTSNVEPVHQITGLVNVTREDAVEEDRMFSQKEALANAAHTHDGYFMVPAVLKNKK